MNCSNCPYKTEKKKEPKAETKKFFHNGNIVSAKMKPYSDAFFEITEGKNRGSLVHIWNITK